MGVTSYAKYKSDRIALSCPLAKYRHTRGVDSRPSAVLFVRDAIPTFFCSACHATYSLDALLLELGRKTGDPKLREWAHRLRSSDQEILSIVRTLDNLETLGMFPEVVQKQERHISTVPIDNEPLALQYLTNREIAIDTANSYKVTYDPLRFRICFPRKIQMAHVPAVGRDITNTQKAKYYNYVATGAWCGGDFLVSDTRSRLFIVEGFFDLLKCAPWAWEVDADVVCTWKAAVSQGQLDFLTRTCKSVYVWYDGDAAGNSGARHAMERLAPYFAVVKRVPVPQGTDVGSMTKNQFFTLFEKVRQHGYF